MKRVLALSLCIVSGLIGLVLLSCDREDTDWALFDPDEKFIVISQDSLSLIEGGAARTFDVTLGMVPSDVVTVNFLSTTGDVEISPATIKFTSGSDGWSDPLTISVSAIEGDGFEGPHNDSLNVTTSSKDDDYDSWVPSSPIVAWIQDTDVLGLKTTGTTNLSVNESSDPPIKAIYTMALMSLPEDSVTVTVSPDYEIEDDLTGRLHMQIGEQDEDLTSVVFTPTNWSDSVQVALWVDADLVSENGRNIDLRHLFSSEDENYAQLNPIVVPLQVHDSTDLPSVDFSLSPDSLWEASPADSVTVEVTLSWASALNVQVDLVTGGGNATADADYVSVDTTITFMPGATSVGIPVFVVDDPDPEPSEVFQVSLGNPVNCSLGSTDPEEIHIVDDDKVTLTVPDVEYSEAEGQAIFAIVRSPDDAGFPMSIHFETGGGNATPNEDYISVSSDPSYTSNQETLYVPVPLINNTIGETTETFEVTISGSQVNTVVAVCTIIDDDAAEIEFNDVSFSEDDGVATFSLVLTKAYEFDVLITVNTLDGDGSGPPAQAPEDYIAISDSKITIPAYAYSLAIEVTLVADDLAEASVEYFQLEITDSGYLEVDGARATCALVDADQPCIFLAPLLEPMESDPLATFVVELRDEEEQLTTSSVDVTFDVLTVAITAVDGTDFDIIDFQEFTIPSGQDTVHIDVPLHEDEVHDDGKSFRLQLSDFRNASDYCAGAGHAFCIIQEDDTSPTLIVVPDQTEASEGDSITFRVELTTARDDLTTFYLDVLAGTATDDDYTFYETGEKSIAAGDTLSDPFTIYLENDLDDAEGTETILIEVSNASDGVPVPPAPTDIYIWDAPVMEISPGAAANEGDDWIFTVNLNRESTAKVKFWISLDDDTAMGGASAGGGSDYRNTITGPFMITPGSLGADFTVTTFKDSIAETLTEQFTITLTDPLNATLGSVVSGDGVITDLDYPCLSVLELVEIEELDSGTSIYGLQVKLHAHGVDIVSSQNDISFSVTAIFQSAVGDDFTFADIDTIIRPEDDGVITLPVTIIGDTEREFDEDFRLEFSNFENCTGLCGSSPVIRILNDDADLVLVVVPQSESEGNSVTATVTKIGDSDKVIGFELKTEDGIGDDTATGGLDYGSISHEGSFASGETEFTMGIHLIPDDIVESNETFLVNLTTTEPGVDVINSPVTVTILDDDTGITLSLSPTPPVYEGGSLTCTVTKSGLDIPVEFNLVTLGIGDYAGATASGILDYEVINWTPTLDIETLSAEKSMAIVSEDGDEPNETFFLRLRAYDSGVSVIGDSLIMVEIIDTDPPPENGR